MYSDTLVELIIIQVQKLIFSPYPVFATHSNLEMAIGGGGGWGAGISFTPMCLYVGVYFYFVLGI